VEISCIDHGHITGENHFEVSGRDRDGIVKKTPHFDWAKMPSGDSDKVLNGEHEKVPNGNLMVPGSDRHEIPDGDCDQVLDGDRDRDEVPVCDLEDLT
jgi:hypothetical protein